MEVYSEEIRRFTVDGMREGLKLKDIWGSIGVRKV